MGEYIASIEIECPESLSEDQADQAFDQLVESSKIVDPILSTSEDSVRLSYSVDCDNAKTATEAGLRALIDVLDCDGQKVIELEARPYLEDDPNELVSKSEIARRLEKSREWIGRLASQGKLPKPVQRGHGGRDLYRWGDIQRQPSKGTQPNK